MTPQDRKIYVRGFQREWVRKQRQEWLLANGPCRQCGSSLRLEVDHVDPTQKVSHKVWSWSKERRSEELSKCQILCHSCHRQKTAAFNRARQTGKRGVALKLEETQVLEIFRLAHSGIGPREIARKFGIVHSTVVEIRDGKIWSWLTSGDAKARTAAQFHYRPSLAFAQVGGA